MDLDKPAFITTCKGVITDPEDYSDTVAGYCMAALEDETLGHFVHEKAENLRLLATHVLDERTKGQCIAAAELMESSQYCWN